MYVLRNFKFHNRAKISNPCKNCFGLISFISYQSNPVSFPVLVELFFLFSRHLSLLLLNSIFQDSGDQAWARLKNILKSKSKFIESKFSELKSKSVFIESVFYVFVFDFGTTSVYRKITIRYISIQNSTGVISINIELYRFYSIISKWHRFQLLLKNREYFPSVISVSDRFLFKKRFYFDTVSYTHLTLPTNREV